MKSINASRQARLISAACAATPTTVRTYRHGVQGRRYYYVSDDRTTEVAWTRAHLWIRTQSVLNLTPVAVATGKALRTSQRFWPTWCDRVSERKVDQSRAAGQQRGFVDISGCIGRCPDHDQEPEQPLVRASVPQQFPEKPSSVEASN